MAIVSDRKMIYERKIAELQTQLTQVSWGSAWSRSAASVGPPPQWWKIWRSDFPPNLFQDEPMDTDQSSTFLSSIQSEIAKYQLLIEEENQKLKRYKVSSWPPASEDDVWGGAEGAVQLRPVWWALMASGLFPSLTLTFRHLVVTFLHLQIENIRRKHNYLPFIMELLKTLAEHQQLMTLVEKVFTHTHTHSLRPVDGGRKTHFVSLIFSLSCQAKEKQSAKKAQEAKWISSTRPASCSHTFHHWATQILYVVCHIHRNARRWRRRRRCCSMASSCAVQPQQRDCLSDGGALSMCPSAPTHDRRKDVLRLSPLIFIIKCRCLWNSYFFFFLKIAINVQG